jgi:hypothetical protein
VNALHVASKVTRYRAVDAAVTTGEETVGDAGLSRPEQAHVPTATVTRRMRWIITFPPPTTCIAAGRAPIPVRHCRMCCLEEVAELGRTESLRTPFSRLLVDGLLG